MRAICTVGFFASVLSFGATIGTSVDCPHDPHESCRWTVSAKTEPGALGLRVRIGWEKSVVSRHWEKPKANTLQCNVDRDFNPTAGGYLKVWFEGDSKPCDAMAGNPADCGVTFLLEDPTQLYSSHGVSVEAPQGKKLAQVELHNTLNLQCGNFGRADYARFKWNPIIGWSSKRPGDGTYESGLPAQKD